MESQEDISDALSAVERRLLRLELQLSLALGRIADLEALGLETVDLGTPALPMRVVRVRED